MSFEPGKISKVGTSAENVVSPFSAKLQILENCPGSTVGPTFKNNCFGNISEFCQISEMLDSTTFKITAVLYGRMSQLFFPIALVQFILGN